MTKEVKQQFTLRITQANSTELVVILYEMALIFGATIGNLLSVFTMVVLPVTNGMFLVGLKTLFLLVAGIGAGCFIGCLATALAEVLQVFPVLFRRAGLKEGLNISMLFFAAGKVIGALYAFMFVKQI